MTNPPANSHTAIDRIIGKNTVSNESERKIVLNLQTGTLQGTSDGSILYNKATQAWRIQPLERRRLSQHYIEGAGPIDRIHIHWMQRRLKEYASLVHSIQIHNST